MVALSFVVRPLETSEEYDWLFQLSEQAFGDGTGVEGAQRWRRYVTNLPEFRLEQLRGVFREGEQVGGYIIHERVLRMGTANISTGCIGMVVTHLAQRQQGVATAMMEDAISFARAHGHALLLLDGIPKFYHRFGYIDVTDIGMIDVKLDAVLAQPQSPYATRVATVEDAEGVLALYQRHYYAYTGSFVRSLEQQRYRLSSRNQLMLALASNGEIHGYLSAIEGNTGHEMAADNWEAMLALLHYHAHVLEGNDTTGTLCYRLRPDSSMVQLMIEQLEVPDTSQWRHPADEWALRSERYHHRDAGWMARFVHLPTFMQAMLPELQARWQKGLACWTGVLRLVVGEEVTTLHIAGTGLSLDDEPGDTAFTVQFTPQAFTQLAFGYRAVDWAVRSGQNDLSAEMLAVLAVLFPQGHAWIARSDWF